MSFFCFFFFFLPFSLVSTTVETCRCVHRCTFQLSIADGCFNVWSPLSPIVHALSSLQVANAQCMTLRSLAPCLRAAREKHRFAAGKKTSERKKTRLAAGKKTPCSGKKLFPQREKTPAKNAASQREKFKAAEKHLAAAQKHLCSRKKCILEAAGKNRPRREKPVRGKKKPAEAGKKPAAEKVQLCNPKSCRNGKNTFPQRKKQQPPAKCPAKCHAKCPAKNPRQNARPGKMPVAKCPRQNARQNSRQNTRQNARQNARQKCPAKMPGKMPGKMSGKMAAAKCLAKFPANCPAKYSSIKTSLLFVKHKSSFCVISGKIKCMSFKEGLVSKVAFMVLVDEVGPKYQEGKNPTTTKKPICHTNITFYLFCLILQLCFILKLFVLLQIP